jgi:hypothetical protein
MIAAQDAPPRLGEIECSYSTIVGPCPAMRTSDMGQERRFERRLVCSGFPRQADIAGGSRHVSNVPLNEPALAGGARGAVGRLGLPQ